MVAAMWPCVPDPNRVQTWFCGVPAELQMLLRDGHHVWPGVYRVAQEYVPHRVSRAIGDNGSGHPACLGVHSACTFTGVYSSVCNNLWFAS